MWSFIGENKENRGYSMKFYSMRKFNFILILVSIMFVNTNALNATAYISEVINNTDQFVCLAYPVPARIRMSRPVAIDLNNEELSTRFLEYDAHKGTQIRLERRTKTALDKAYLPNTTKNQNGSFIHGIYLYMSPKVVPKTSSLFLLGNSPFKSIRRNKDWAEASPYSSYEKEKYIKRISSDPIIDGESYRLELNQLSDEVFVRSEGQGVCILDGEIEIVIKRNTSYKKQVKQSITRTDNTLQPTKQPQASVVEWVPGFMAPGRMSSGRRILSGDLSEWEKKLPLEVTISFDQEVSLDFVNKFFKYLSTVVHTVVYTDNTAIRRLVNKKHFVFKVDYSTKQSDFQLILDKANRYFESKL
jgi:hypothetical protein